MLTTIAPTAMVSGGVSCIVFLIYFVRYKLSDSPPCFFFFSSRHTSFTKYTVVTYIVSGRVDETSEWVMISEGDLPWRYVTSNPARNARGLGIASTYESGDSRREYTEVTFEENTAAFMHYKVQFPDSRNGGDAVQFSEVELPGYLQ